MEEEYRMQKAQAEVPRPASDPSSPSATGANGTNGELVTVIHEDGSVSRSPVGSGLPKRGESLNTGGAGGADDNASTRAVRSAANTPTPSHTAKESMSVHGGNGLPTIRISTESNREREKERVKAEENGEDQEGEEVKDEEMEGVLGEGEGKGKAKENGVKVEALEKPSQIGIQDGDNTANPSQEAFSFSNKRLCERWLDNLFMVLYEVMFSFHPIPLSIFRTHVLRVMNRI